MDVLDRSRDLYRAGLIKAALVAVREVCEQEPGNAEAWWMLGCIARHAGLIAVSDDGFRRASELLPLQRPMPHRVTVEHFRALVEEAKRVLDDSAAVSPSMPERGKHEELRRLPEEAARILPDAAAARRWGIIVPGRAAAARQDTDVMPLPGPDIMRAGLSPDARWVHEGQRVILYQVNHENAAGSDRDLVHVIVRSLLFADDISRHTTRKLAPQGS